MRIRLTKYSNFFLEYSNIWFLDLRVFVQHSADTQLALKV